MSKVKVSESFQATLQLAKDTSADEVWAFVVLPTAVSEQLPRRGRTSVIGTVNGAKFSATLEPDGQLSHWLRVDSRMLTAAKAAPGDTVTVQLQPVEQEPEPAVPEDFQKALDKVPVAHAVWQATTTLARVDWIHWIESAKQSKTRAKRIYDACQMLAEGKKRVCCFDPSGFYSKALRAPQSVD